MSLNRDQGVKDFYPPDIAVPSELRTDQIVLRPLRATDVDLDYDAVISSRPLLLLLSGGDWPREGFTLEENLTDLRRHEQEHHERSAFTFTVMNLAETECVGCIYISPLAAALARVGGGAECATVGAYEAWVTFWVRQSRLADNLDARLLRALRAWFRADWAFHRVVFAAGHAETRQCRLFDEAGLCRVYSLPRMAVYG
jgi:hypothetical protein